jgi:hypothetical protein
VLAGNTGFLAGRPEFIVPVFMDYTVNAFNDIDLLNFRRYRAVPVLSPELTLAEMIGFRNKEAVILVHGDLVLVNTRVDLSGVDLTDDKGELFPTRQEGSYWQILNCRPFGMFNDIRKLRDAGFTRFLIDKKGRGAHLTGVYREMLKGEVPDRRLRRGYTSGHLYRPVP